MLIIIEHFSQKKLIIAGNLSNIVISSVFDDPQVQEAYEACVAIDFKVTLHRNPGISQTTFDRVAPQSL